MYHRGKGFARSWVFGMLDSNEKIAVLQIVDKRDQQTLMPIITKHISKDAKVHHDDWAVYRNLHQYGYDHSKVIHTKEFKAADGTHTNGIEGTWGVLKQRLCRMHGYPHERLQVFLDEYCFRLKHKGELVKAILNAIK